MRPTVVVEPIICPEPPMQSHSLFISIISTLSVR